MWSHAGDRLLSRIFGGGERRDGTAAKTTPGRKSTPGDRRAASFAEATNRSLRKHRIGTSGSKGHAQVAQSERQKGGNKSEGEEDEDEEDDNGEVTGEDEEEQSRDSGARIQNSLSSSSGAGTGGAGGSSSGYTSQLSAAGGFVSGANATAAGALNGDRNNNNSHNHNHNHKLAHLHQHAARGLAGAHERTYHSLVASAQLARQPMVPMMIDDEDAGEPPDDEDEEQTLDFELNDEYLARHQHEHHNHRNHHHHHNHHQHPHHLQQQQLHDHRSLRLIDGLRRLHEMRYSGAVGGADDSGDQLYLPQQQSAPPPHRPQGQRDDKLSLANPIMFRGEGTAAAAATAASQRHFASLPPADATSTSRGTTLLAGARGGGAECAPDSDDAASSPARLHANHPHPHHPHHQLAYEAADLRAAHLARVGGGGGQSNSHLTTGRHHQRHHSEHEHDHEHDYERRHGHFQQQQNHLGPGTAAIYYQPDLVNGESEHQSGRGLGARDGRRHLLAARAHSRSSSFLQFRLQDAAARSGRAAAFPDEQLSRAPGLAQQEARLEFGAQRHDASGSRLASGPIVDANGTERALAFASPLGARPTPTRMRPLRADASSHYLTARDASESSSHTSGRQPAQQQQQQQVRRSRSNQQLSLSPARQARNGVAKSSSSGGALAMPIDGSASGFVAAGQAGAGLAAAPAAPSGRRRGAGNGQLGADASLALGCCGKLAKFLLFIANILFWCAGIALGAWGILALVEDHKYNLSQLLVFDSNTRMSLFQLLAWSFITLGCATILVGVCGCSAMFKNSRWILGLYIFLILAIFALDLATGLLAMIFQERLVANVRLRLVNKLRNEYGLQASFTTAIDYIQTRFECCGLDGHFDYDQSLWRLQRLGGFEATVARTCCHLRNTFDDQAHVNPRPVNESMCQSTDVRFHQSYRYRRGCIDDLERLIRHKIWTFTIGCGIVGAIILLSLALATCFCRSIPSDSAGEFRASGKKRAAAVSGSASRHSSNRVHQQALAHAENVNKKHGYHTAAPHYR